MKRYNIQFSKKKKKYQIYKCGFYYRIGPYNIHQIVESVIKDIKNGVNAFNIIDFVKRKSINLT